MVGNQNLTSFVQIWMFSAMLVTKDIVVAFEGWCMSIYKNSLHHLMLVQKSSTSCCSRFCFCFMFFWSGDSLFDRLTCVCIIFTNLCRYIWNCLSTCFLLLMTLHCWIRIFFLKFPGISLWLMKLNGSKILPVYAQTSPIFVQTLIYLDFFF